MITDSLFSMDGDCAPLPELAALCRDEQASLLIDEAHALGTCGLRGGGLAEEHQLQSRIDVRIGTLSKAIGTLGGFVVGSKDLIDWTWNRARPHIFSTALPPAICAAASKAIEILQAEPQRRQKLDALAEQLRTGLKRLGLKISSAERGPIVPVILETPQRAVGMAAQLAERGFLVGAIRPPSVPPGTSRLRITLSAAFDSADVEQLLAALADLLPASSALQ
ncbi:MAG: aminotransferase class I/II-fold pyridoxal phosphate-dependent enzyme [Planctomycetales bacterium]